jgi:hypothetical protein
MHRRRSEPRKGAAPANDRLGGHLVSGHVDGVGLVRSFTPNRRTARNGAPSMPAALARYIARKGSVTVKGVSLTVNASSTSTTAALRDQPDPAHCGRSRTSAVSKPAAGSISKST